MKKISSLIIAALLILSVGMTAGCGGRRATANVQANTTTLGQELIDLQQAYEKGIISEKEYNDLKKKAVKKYK
jgi:hypothetical protein